jgi:hypothetical protein
LFRHAREVLVGFGSTIALVTGSVRTLTQTSLGRLESRSQVRFAQINIQLNDTRDKIMLNKLLVATHSSGSSQRKKIASMNLVSATVFLLPDKLAIIQQLCAQKNRRISDLISEAVDDYLCKCS